MARAVPGFSLLETLIAVLLLALLLAMALPSYQRYTLRSQRVEAIREILLLADCLERQRAESGYYNAAACKSTLNNPHYDFLIESENGKQSQSYRIVANPRTSRADDPCGILSLDHVGTRGSADGKDLPANCWSGR